MGLDVTAVFQALELLSHGLRSNVLGHGQIGCGGGALFLQVTQDRHLRDRGHGIVHISHRLEELKQITDRVTVMRDGRYVRTVSTAEASTQEIISMMVGRTVFEATPD